MPKLTETAQKRNEELVKRAVEMRSNGVLLVDIAATLKRSYTWVWKVLNNK